MPRRTRLLPASSSLLSPSSIRTPFESPLARLLVLCVFALWLGACGGDDPASTSCVPGHTTSCACPGGQTGVQACTDAKQYGACQCGTDPGDAGFDGGDDTTDPFDPTTNACGGQGELRLDGASAAPGEPCGPCGDGLIVCDSPEELRCARASARNACGGCEVLPGAPDQACGTCGRGTWKCDGEDAVVCEGDDTNACEGCSTLGAVPLHVCQSETSLGVWHCQTTESLVCIGPGMNACGGSTALETLPGVPCGECGEGIYRCAGPEEVVCDTPEPNACGGCEPLRAAPGTPCGDCQGTWECDGSGQVVCRDTTNLCGGCAELPQELGASCGEGRHYVCDGPNALACKLAVVNPCGGIATLVHAPGEACGACGDGVFTCIAPNRTECMGATAENVCGGCARLHYKPDQSCGVCESGRWACDGAEALSCVGQTDLARDPDNCGVCGNSCGEGHTCEEGLCRAVRPTAPVSGVGVAAGQHHTCAHRADGRVWCWGNDMYGTITGAGTWIRYHAPFEVPVTDVVQLRSKSEHTCALRRNGQVVCWGINDQGQLGIGPADRNTEFAPVTGLTDAVSVVTGDRHSCALRATGQVVCWGQNTFGQLGTGDTNHSRTPVAVAGLADVVEIVAGSQHTCARLADRSVQCWGRNSNGQLGVIAPNQSPTPVAVRNLGATRALAAGEHFTCAVLATGLVRCWGLNSLGQLGDASTRDSVIPVQVNGQADVVKLYAGYTHVCAVNGAGAAYCWGEGTHGQLGEGTYRQDSDSALLYKSTAVPVALDGEVVTVVPGRHHTCAVMRNSQILCWGRNYYGQLGDGQLVGDQPNDRRFPTAVLNQGPTTSEAGQCRDSLDNDGNGATDCADAACATNLGSMLGEAVATGNTCLHGNYFRGSCATDPDYGTRSGPEMLFVWKAPEAGTYVFDTQAAGYSHHVALYAFDGSCVGPELGCQTGSAGSSGPARLTLHLAANKTIVLVVDGAGYDESSGGSSCGTFQLNITKQ